MIPPEAVEAAAKVYRREFPHDENEDYIVKLVLEAAYPHMLAEWEELQKREAFEALRRIDEQMEAAK